MKRFKFYSKDRMMKILSVIIAVLLWSYVMSEVDPVITRTFYNVPVEYQNPSVLKDKGLFLISPRESFVDVTVRGKRKSVNEMVENDIKASIDLANAMAGGESMLVRIRLADPTINIHDQSPNRITVEVDKLIEKSLPLELETMGEMPDGYILDEVTKSDDRVLVKGPKTAIDSIYTVIAEVKVDGRRETTLINAPVKAFDKDKKEISSISIEPSVCEVQAKISKTKTVPIELTYSDALPEDFLKERVEITPSSVLLSGESKELDKIDTIKTSEISPQKLLDLETIPISLNIPEGVKLANATENFIVRYNTEDKVSKEINLSTSQIKDQYGNWIPKEVKRRPNMVTVSVRGESGLISALNIEDFSLRVTTEKFKDKEKLQLEVDAPAGIEILSIEPRTIELTRNK